MGLQECASVWCNFGLFMYTWKVINLSLYYKNDHLNECLTSLAAMANCHPCIIQFGSFRKSHGMEMVSFGSNSKRNKPNYEPINFFFFNNENKPKLNHLAMVWFGSSYNTDWERNTWGRRIDDWCFNFKNPWAVVAKCNGRRHATFVDNPVRIDV